MQEDNGCKILSGIVDAQEVVYGSGGGPTVICTMAAFRRHGTGRKECKNPQLTERYGSSPQISCKAVLVNRVDAHPHSVGGGHATKYVTEQAPRQVGETGLRWPQ